MEERKDLWNRRVWSLERKAEGTNGESEDRDCNEVTCARWFEPAEESDQDEIDGMKEEADSTGKVMYMANSGCWFASSVCSMHVCRNSNLYSNTFLKKFIRVKLL